MSDMYAEKFPDSLQAVVQELITKAQGGEITEDNQDTMVTEVINRHAEPLVEMCFPSTEDKEKYLADCLMQEVVDLKTSFEPTAYTTVVEVVSKNLVRMDMFRGVNSIFAEMQQYAEHKRKKEE